MKSTWLYIFAVLLLPLLRTIVLDLPTWEWLEAVHWSKTANVVVFLRSSPIFVSYMGNLALLVFVSSVFIFWLMEGADVDIPKHFPLLPIVYIPFSIVGTVLMTAEFHFSYLYTQPFVILLVGYMYVGVWMALIWLLTKMNLVQ